ncbi:MAG TPA: hypothetical protein VFS17_07790 [Methylophilaceae bacterium]|nr:hypothetical protein [Methylophilaceae bacterium]
MMTRRNFILGLLAFAAASQLPRICRLVLTDPRTELRSGWIMMKGDR